MSSAPDELFEQALDLDPLRRRAFLESACGADRGLLTELLSLLDAHERHPAFLPLSPWESTEEASLEKIGPFEIRSEFGRGGMGIVYEAVDTRRSARVALKRLHATGLRFSSRSALVREARLLAALDHPAIARIFTVERHDEIDVISMEYVDGVTLGERLHEGALETQDALWIALQVAMALEAAHTRGVLHLDLKPENVMLERTPEAGHTAGLPGLAIRPWAKVLDFGIGRWMGKISRTDLALGTPGYASPEQIDGRPLDARADLWSLGCLLFEMLAGRPAFPGASGKERLDAVRRGEVSWEEIPQPAHGVSDLTRALLAGDRTGRPPDAGAVRAELTRAFHGATSRDRVVSGDRAATAGAARTPVTREGEVPLVGRQMEQAHIRAYLAGRPLVTLTGPGGVGKTRLAREVVASDAIVSAFEVVHMIDLAPQRGPGLVPAAVAAALGIGERRGVTVEQQMIDTFGDRRILLVLDNCEAVLAACAELVRPLLRECPRLRLLVTSREPLGLAGEVVYRVPPLAVPPEDARTLEELERYDAARLFLSRMRAGPDASSLSLGEREIVAVAALCARLDGLPLALELVARQTAHHPLSDVLASMETARRAAGSPERERRVSADAETGARVDVDADPDESPVLAQVLAHGHDLLPGPEKQLFRRLAVFEGGWTLETLAGVLDHAGQDASALSPLLELVDRSLVVLESGAARAGRVDSDLRYRMLEPIREFAASMLAASGEAEGIRSAHRRHFFELARSAAPHLRGAEQDSWFARLDEERHNLRIALEDLDPGTEEVELGLRTCTVLGRYWSVRGHWSEGRRTIERLLAAASDSNTEAWVKAVNWAGNLAFNAGHLEDARERYERAALGGAALEQDALTAAALNNLGVVHIMSGRFDEAREVLERVLDTQRLLGDEAEVATVLLNLGVVAERQHVFDLAAERYRESLEIRRRLGDRHAVALSLNNLGTVSEKRDDLDTAAAYHEEALEIRRELGDARGIAETLHNLGAIAARREETDLARDRYTEALVQRRRVGDSHGVAETLEALAALLASSDTQEAARCLGEAEALRARVSVPATPDGARRREETVATLRAHLSRSRLDAALAEGRARDTNSAH